MDTVLDVVPVGETVLPVIADKAAPVDLLNRQEIVDNIMKILTVIHERRSSCTFALNGAWGTGKTFVLNMLMNRLWEYHSDDYIVFHYNCWQYDYYEEPLIAIVAAMLDSVDEENHLLRANLRDGVKVGMGKAKKALGKIAADFVKNKIGVDLTDVISAAKDYQTAVDDEKQKREDSRSFDEFYSFKKAIQQAQTEIEKISADRTLVVVVDELDRCLPAYAIKVLERLHHLFSGIRNMAVILAVDKSHLEKTVMQIWGENTSTAKYLQKFINFELDLDVGEINDSFRSKYRDYFELFDESLIKTDFPYDRFLSSLFAGIDARRQEQLMKRITTIHTILYPESKQDYSLMCAELMYIVLDSVCGTLYGSVYKNVDCENIPFIPFEESSDKMGNVCFILSKELSQLMPEFSEFVDRFWSSEYVSGYLKMLPGCTQKTLCRNGSIQKYLIHYFTHLAMSCISILHYKGHYVECSFDKINDDYYHLDLDDYSDTIGNNTLMLDEIVFLADSIR